MALDRLVDSTQLNGDLSAVADAIRSKGGTNTGLAFPAGFVSAIQAITSGAGNPYQIALAINANTLQSWTVPVSNIKPRMFYGCSNLTSFDFSQTISIGDNAFEQCGLTSVSIQNAVTIGNSAFAASRVASLLLPEYTGGAVSGVFTGCTNLTSVHLPKVTQLGINAFRSCTNLVYMVLPKITSIGSYFTYGDNKLEAADLGGATLSIAANAFANGAVLDTLVIRASTPAALANVNAFAGTPFASSNTGGTLYVPNALISSYQAAANWSTVLGYPNNSITAIEGSAYENSYVDGTPIAAI